MGGRNKADIVTTFGLQFEHHFCQSFVRYLVLFLRFPGLRDLKILAIDAAQITVSKENITCAVCAGKTRFFAKMRRVARNNRQSARITSGNFTLQTIISAVFRTNGTGFKQFFECLNSGLQFVPIQEFQELWDEVGVFLLHYKYIY